eukprot:TRINITY_DN13391_c0_g2_i2.p1 TRINITY_DN13391_c0_g2~~TRINITY_DN13391_c0_g2_i2.p1  ORF type:complete len:219 (-),score=69.21 TRINITY_DN13391_c0_g2_i2:62-718(-)
MCIRDRSTPARKKRAATLGERAAGEAVQTEDVTAAPKADSSAVLLTQALHNEDSALLEDCLSCRDPALISNTVKRLPVTSVVPFLEQVVVRMKSRPNRTKLLAHWIRAVLTEHSSYLGTVPAAGAVIAEFYETLDQRLTAMPHLLQLQGRLQLITSHINKASAGRSKPAASAAIVFDEPTRDDDGEEESEEEGSEEEDEEMDMRDDSEMDSGDDSDDL